MKEIKLKNLDRREWYDDTQRDFRCRYQKDDFFEGGIGLITFTGLTEPEVVDGPEGKLCIGDNRYQWLEMAPKDGNYVITTMFRENEIFQHYVDITLRNEVAENGDAVFYDMFLDVVVTKDGKALILDEDELEEAYKEGVIGIKEYELAKRTAEEVIDLFASEKEKLEERICGYCQLLCSK